MGSDSERIAARSPNSLDPVAAATAAAAGTTAATAVRCAERGWPVLPLAPGRKTPAGNCPACRRPGHTHAGCPCPGSGRWCHGFHAATRDLATIQRWWGGNPGFGVAVACGPADLVVLDVDAHEQPLPERGRILPGIPIGPGVDLTGLANGFHSLAVLAALRGAVDPAEDDGTLRVRTPSGGLHIWYRARPGQHWRCSTGSGSGTGRSLAWQVDIRAQGGYIVAPGTVTRAGAYTAVGTSREPAVLPDWLARELERTGHLVAPGRPARALGAPTRPVGGSAFTTASSFRLPSPAAAATGRRATNTVLAGLLAEVAGCAAVSEGAGFSEKLNRAAYTVGGLVAAGHLSRPEAEHVLEAAAAVARPGQESRYRSIIRGGLRAGTARPLSLGGIR